MRPARTLLLIAFLPMILLMPASVSGEEDEALLDSKTARSLEKIAKDLASQDCYEEMLIVLGVLEDLGRKPALLVKLRKSCDKALDRARPSASKMKSIRKRVSQVADALGERMDGAASDEAPILARQILLLDASREDAHDMLNHVESEDGDGWLPKEKEEAAEGSLTIRGVLLRARHRLFFTEKGESDRDIIEKVCGSKGNKVTWENLELHGPLPQARLERMLKTALRARSVSQEIIYGETQLKKLRAPKTFILINSKPAFVDALQIAAGEGKIATKDLARYREMSGVWIDPSKTLLVLMHAEMPALAQILFHISDWGGTKSRRIQPTLRAGHINWVCLNCFGIPMPKLAWTEKNDPGDDRASTTVHERERKLREERHRVAKAGIVGCRSWMEYLASRREDPAWSSTMVDRVAKLGGDPLLKATMVVAYLQELGKLSEIMQETARPEADGDTLVKPAFFEEALGKGLTEFERCWRTWLLPVEPGVLARLDGIGGVTATEAETRAVADLDRIRQLAFTGRDLGEYVPLLLVPGLSAGARAHAHYLGKHPAQLAAWPDAHEEWPDKEGFSVAGSAAGLHSVITPDARTPELAISNWMATFYHRLPLLSPGLKGIGWGSESGISVLDSGSLVEPWMKDDRFVVWPHDGMRNVPLRFRRELPHPVPGENQNRWGYPITLQGTLRNTTFTMKLYDGKPTPENLVPCHLSTPWEPTNPELAPDGAACLIPKAALKPGATYTVEVKGLPGGRSLRWSFRTGRQ
jgi:hypothetical protein